MKKLLLLSLSFGMIATTAWSQKDKFWSFSTTNPGSVIAEKAVARQGFPHEFKLFELDAITMKQQLFSIVSNGGNQTINISVPNADGQLEQFEMVEASNFDPQLQARFPDIRSFSGRSLTNPGATIKLSYSPQGIQTMVFRPDNESEFIEPYSADHKLYAVYRSQREKGKLPWSCTTEDIRLADEVGNNRVVKLRASGSSSGTLKTLRLAQSVNGEYSNYFGAFSSADVANVLAAVNATLTRCNGVFEKDLAIHLNLIPNTTDVFYYNPSTDPYSPNLSNWNLQLQQTLTSVIGSNNYDIGHMFGASGGGGNAGCIGCVCVNPNNNRSVAKGGGITSPADGIPQGDNFDIDYVAHEMGHQLGANHTFSFSNEGTGQNKEIGSGITIMGYAGITSYDVAPHSFEIFHETSIAQIQSNLAGKSCPVTSSANNNAPSIGAVSNYTIPISTPFALTASVTDLQNDPLTYCWEQNDNSSTSGSGSVASPTKTSGPNFLSFLPSSSPTRLFPKLATILAGQNVSGPLPGGDAIANTEALSSVSRTLNFRLTVRDNHPYSSSPSSVGQTAFTDVVVTVTNTSGPFAVTAPNTNVTWTGGSTAAVTWSVSGTNGGLVNCQNVKILLSTDGGNTFPTVLASSTANDGSENITVPNTPGTNNRIKVESIGNIFFDISNSNFTIVAGGPTCNAPTGLASSGITTTSANVSWSAVTGAVSYDVDYKKASDGSWTNAATGTASISLNLSSLSSGTLYDWRVRTNCSSGSSGYTQAQFTTATPPCNAPTGLGSTNITETTATVSWSVVSGAQSYDVSYKEASSGTWINAATGTTSTSVNLSGLSSSTLYDWQVRTNCSSGSSGYVQDQFTTSTPATCEDPSGLTTFNITETSATVSWNNISGPTSFELDYKPAASGTWIPATISGNPTSADLSGLTANTLYDWRVRTICSSGTSNYLQAQFTTAASTCVAPSGLSVSNLTDNSATVSWDNVGAVSYDVDYKPVSSSNWISVASGTTSTSVNITGLSPATTYDWQVRSNCSFISSDYVQSQFTTSGTTNPCPGEYDIEPQNNSTGSAPTISLNTDIYGLVDSKGDNDYYKFVITTGGTIIITLTNLPADYHLALANSSGTLQSSTNNGPADESITRTVTAGTYWARVYPKNNGQWNANSCYTLRVATGTASRISPDELITGNQKLQVSPNPVRSNLNLNFTATENGLGTLSLIDQSGAVVLTKPVQMNAGLNNRSLFVGHLANGMYYVKLTTKTGVQMSKVMISK